MEACAGGAIPVVTGIPTFRLLTGNGSVGALWKVGDVADGARAIVDVARRDLDVERARLHDHFGRGGDDVMHALRHPRVLVHD